MTGTHGLPDDLACASQAPSLSSVQSGLGFMGADHPPLLGSWARVTDQTACSPPNIRQRFGSRARSHQPRLQGHTHTMQVILALAISCHAAVRKMGVCVCVCLLCLARCPHAGFLRDLLIVLVSAVDVRHRTCDTVSCHATKALGRCRTASDGDMHWSS